MSGSALHVEGDGLRPGRAERASRPGPRYDNGLRLLAGKDLVAVCESIGIQADAGSVRRSEALPGTTLHADLIARTGRNRLVHVEFFRRPQPGLALRMLEYRVRILRLHPGHVLTQHILVLAGGNVVNDLERDPQVSLRLDVIYLRDQDPAQFLANPSVAPLAVLAAARDHDQRVENLRKALAVIGEVTDTAHREDLQNLAVTLAGIHLTPATINQLTSEAEMIIYWDEDTVAGQAIIEERVAKGVEEGVRKGVEEERVGVYADLMAVTFGEDPRIPVLAERLAQVPRARAIRLASTATSLDDLEAALS